MLSFFDGFEIISSFRNKSKSYKKIQNRLNHGFIYKIKGNATYFFDGKKIEVKAGEMIFVPQGSSYEYMTDESEENLYTSINFRAEIENPTVKVYSLSNFHGAGYVAESFSQLWKFGTVADKYKCLSIFYDLISYVSRIDSLGASTKTSGALIEPAINYLHSHIYDLDFKVDKLHRLCGISDTYFRKIFYLRFNMSPQEYVLTQRISHARSIIESGDYESIKEVAELVGYNDPLYFSKSFKKFYGFSPSDINS